MTLGGVRFIAQTKIYSTTVLITLGGVLFHYST